jgi:hypothetical protein
MNTAGAVYKLPGKPEVRMSVQPALETPAGCIAFEYVAVDAAIYYETHAPEGVTWLGVVWRKGEV